jgi:hypothetical protein
MWEKNPMPKQAHHGAEVRRRTTRAKPAAEKGKAEIFPNKWPNPFLGKSPWNIHIIPWNLQCSDRKGPIAEHPIRFRYYGKNPRSIISGCFPVRFLIWFLGWRRYCSGCRRLPFFFFYMDSCLDGGDLGCVDVILVLLFRSSMPSCHRYQIVLSISIWSHLDALCPPPVAKRFILPDCIFGWSSSKFNTVDMQWTILCLLILLHCIQYCVIGSLLLFLMCRSFMSR